MLEIGLCCCRMSLNLAAHGSKSFKNLRMSPTEQPLMVIGHKNPDTDSICSAIAYAHYKVNVAGMAATSYRAGNLNPQTRFVLDYFKVQEPPLLTTMFPKLSDIMIQAEHVLALCENDTLGTAQELITKQRFAFVPVTAASGKYAGKVSALRLASLLQDMEELCSKPVDAICFPSFVALIQGQHLMGDLPTAFQGNVWFQGFALSPRRDEQPVLAVLADGSEANVAEVCRGGASVIVVCATPSLDEKVFKLLHESRACVVTTSSYALSVISRLCLSVPLHNFVERHHPTFKHYDLVRDVQKELRKSNEGGFVVVDDDGFIRGIITRLSFLTDWRFRVALVDHNELSQAVDGVEEATVEEIIDHHRLGYRSTDQPITFINKVVGCTCTIIAELYRNSRQDPPPQIAGLMLSAILSDTVILQSPTTTSLDRELAAWLAGLAGVEIDSFGARMFSAGCAVEGADPKMLIQQDLKIYEENGWKLSVSQMETVGLEAFKSMREALVRELEHAKDDAGCQFSCLMVTDITSSTSLLLCAGEEKIIHAITYPKVGENLFEMVGVLSRKKQMMPYLVDLLKGL
jgi:manganese-dependent inorganic pyrophosphatase